MLREQFSTIWAVLSSPLAGGLLLNRFITVMSTTILLSNFGVVIMEVFGLEPEYIGYIMSYSGVIGVFSSYLIGQISQYFGRHFLIITASFGSIILNIFTVTIVTSLTGWLLLMPFEAIFTTIFTTLNLAMYGSAFPKEKIGFAMGVAGSVDSIARIIAPLLSGVIFHYAHVTGIRLSCALLIALNFFVWEKMILTSQLKLVDVRMDIEQQKVN